MIPQHVGGRKFLFFSIVQGMSSKKSSHCTQIRIYLVFFLFSSSLSILHSIVNAVRCAIHRLSPHVLVTIVHLRKPAIARLLQHDMSHFLKREEVNFMLSRACECIWCMSLHLYRYDTSIDGAIL